jgi:uncharacterized protein YceK
MTFRAIRVAVLLSSLPLMGCGTVANLARQGPGDDMMSPFGGVHHDLSCMQSGATGETHPRSQPDQHAETARTLLCAADLPLSLVGDVVTWPYVVAYCCVNQPIPVPPVTGAPPPPMPPATGGVVRPYAYPLETMPEPRKLP